MCPLINFSDVSFSQDGQDVLVWTSSNRPPTRIRNCGTIEEAERRFYRSAPNVAFTRIKREFKPIKHTADQSNNPLIGKRKRIPTGAPIRGRVMNT